MGILLANNGPWESFGLWVEKYGFTHIFDDIINSERDGLVKPTSEFQNHVRSVAGNNRIRLIDDRTDIVECARQWGWTGVQSKCVTSYPVERWNLPSSSSIWSE
jgi:FMN phosphatase YigB (HAD superfamily)